MEARGVRDVTKTLRLAPTHPWRAMLWIVCATFALAAVAAEDNLFRIGLSGKRGMLAVAPDGGRLLFTTDSLAHGLRVLDLHTGKIDVIQAEAGRFWEMPNWSHDGKQVVAISTAVRNGYHIVGDMQVILIDPATWRHRTITVGEGVKNLPFFSADGNRVYYFKGVKRESGKTPASRFDLYSIDLATGQERQLTHIFSATPNAAKSMKDAFGKESRNALFHLQAGKLNPIAVDQRNGVFDFYKPQRDKKGNLHFIAAKERSGGGHFLWFLVRSGPDGSKPMTLTELPISMGFGIDRAGDEIVFRRLDGLAAN